MKKNAMRSQNKILIGGSSLIVIYFISFLIFHAFEYFNILNVSNTLKELIFLLMSVLLIFPTIIASFYALRFLSASNIFMKLSVVAISVLSYFMTHGMGWFSAKRLVWTSTGIRPSDMNDILHIMASTTSVLTVIALATIVFNFIFAFSCSVISDYKFHNKTHRDHIKNIELNYKIKKFIGSLTDKKLKNTQMRSIALSMFFIFLLAFYIAAFRVNLENILLNSYLNHDFILNSPKVLCNNLPSSTQIYSPDDSNTGSQNNFSVIIRTQGSEGYVYTHAKCSHD